jgi:hypothetical protein
MSILTIKTNFIQNGDTTDFSDTNQKNSTEKNCLSSVSPVGINEAVITPRKKKVD